jgi:hypothetical protein
MSPKTVLPKPSKKPPPRSSTPTPSRPVYRPPRRRRIGRIPWRVFKGQPAPQLDHGTFPAVQRAAPGTNPVVWVWHSPDQPDVEAWALYRPGLAGGYEIMSPAAGPVDLNLHWLGVQAFRPPTPPQPDQPHLDPPWGDPTDAADRNEFLLFIVNNWTHVGATSELDLLLFDWRAGAAQTPGDLGLLQSGLFRVRENGQAGDAVAWALHVPGSSREIWKLLDPPNEYVAPGSALPDATLWFEGVPGALPGAGDDPAVWLDAWVRGQEARVGANGVLVTHDVQITRVWP